MTCENCIAFAPNMADEAYTCGSSHKCRLYGMMVKSNDEACDRFEIDPMQKEGGEE